MRRRIVRMQAHQLPQQSFSITEPLLPHVQVRKRRQRIERLRLQRECLPIFFLCLRCMLFFERRAGK